MIHARMWKIWKETKQVKKKAKKTSSQFLKFKVQIAKNEDKKQTNFLF